MPDFLETLVKLAAAGTSGICIFAIFAAGYILFKSNPDTPTAKYDALKSFMKMAVVVAVISAGTTIAAGYWDYKTKIALKEENKGLAETAKEQEDTIGKTKKQAIALRSELSKKNTAIASLETAFRKIRPGQTVSQAQWVLINQDIKNINPKTFEVPSHLVIPKDKDIATPMK